ncbi:MAG: metal-dependent transcriptional regulator [Dehalococcoidia bacterium]|jgi:DtxR family Mn-dependent transcriptional regulator
MIEERPEEYLKIIGLAAEHGEEVTTSYLAVRLCVSMPSITQMLQRLAAKGLVEHLPRRPVRLTAEGQRAANSLIRRHRLWESFLVRFLGFSWDEVHEEAGRLEHATSTALEERLVEFLGDLASCPHGHAIPGRKHVTLSTQILPLSQFDSAGAARIIRIRDETPEFLRRLARLDVRPDRVIEVEGVNAEDGSVWVRVDGKLKEVAADLAGSVMVERLKEAAASAADSGAA